MVVVAGGPGGAATLVTGGGWKPEPEGADGRLDSKLDPEIEADVKVPSSSEKAQQSETLQI